MNYQEYSVASGYILRNPHLNDAEKVAQLQQLLTQLESDQLAKLRAEHGMG